MLFLALSGKDKDFAIPILSNLNGNMRRSPKSIEAKNFTGFYARKSQGTVANDPSA